MINAKYCYKEDASGSVYRFQGDYGNHFGRKRGELDGTVLTTFRRFHAEIPVQSCANFASRERKRTEQKKSRWRSRGAEEEPRIYRRKWKWNSRTTMMRIEQTRESRARRRCRSSSLTPDNPATNYTHLECAQLLFLRR